MNLPKTFKFRWVNDSLRRIYYASVVGEKVLIDWDDNDREPSERNISEVEECIKGGSWVIVENDNVNHPSHYQGKTEVIDIIEQATTDLNGFHAYCLGNVIKYVMRHQKKGGITDLKKAAWYLNKVIGGEGE